MWQTEKDFVKHCLQELENREAGRNKSDAAKKQKQKKTTAADQPQLVSKE